MGEVDEFDDAVDQGVAQRDERDQGAVREPDEKHLDQQLGVGERSQEPVEEATHPALPRWGCRDFASEGPALKAPGPPPRSSGALVGGRAERADEFELSALDLVPAHAGERCVAILVEAPLAED